MITPAVNELHAVLRKLSIDDAIAFVAAQIPSRGYDVVKNDPGVYAWVMENRATLEPRAKLGGLNGASQH
jgi:hypothetical protein